MPMLDGDDRIIGTNGYVAFQDPDNPLDEGIVEIPVTEYRVRLVKHFQPVTSSINYDRDTDLLFPSKLQVSAEAEGQIRGRFRMSRVPPTIIASLYAGTSLPIFYFYNDLTREFCSGYFHVREFELMSPVGESVDFSATVVSEGGIYVNTDPAYVNPPAP